MFCYLNYWQVGGQICGKWKCSVEAAHRVVGLSGHAPFESKTGNAQETYGLVKRGIETVHFPGAVNLQVGGLVPLWGEVGKNLIWGFWNKNNFRYGILMMSLFSTQTMYPKHNIMICFGDAHYQLNYES